MRTFKYKIISLVILLSLGLNAQTFDRKISEKFKVNKNVEIEINTSSVDVDIETWNKNEVVIEAVMEVEGMDEKEADKLLEKWDFEALGNKNKVEITSKGRPYFFGKEGNYNFRFAFDFPETPMEIPPIEIPEIEIPEIELPEMVFPEMEIPEIEIEALEFDYQRYKNDSTYLKNYKKQIQKQVEKFKNSEWIKKMDSFKNTKAYKERVEAIKLRSKEYAKQIKESDWHKKMQDYKNSEAFKRTMEASKRATEEVKKQLLEHKELIREQQEVMKEVQKEMIAKHKEMRENGKLDSLKKYKFRNFYWFDDSETSKIKINKYLKIKVPKNATYKLNVRHGKLNIPKSATKISANVSYGNFNGGEINGNSNVLKINNSPVVVENMNFGTITLKNVPNASFGTFNNSKLFSNSSNVKINTVGKDVDLNQKFGKIEIATIMPQFNSLSLNLNYTKAFLPFDKITANYEVDTYKTRSTITASNTDFFKKIFVNVLSKHETTIKGSFDTSTKTNNKINLKAAYSSLTIH